MSSLNDAISYFKIEADARFGLSNWRNKPHNEKWWKRIDGTPIPNDLVVCIAEEISKQLARALAAHDQAESIPSAEWHRGFEVGKSGAAYGTTDCPICGKSEGHTHTELVKKGLPMALAIGSCAGLHHTAAVLGKMREEYEAAHDQKVRAEVRDATLREVKKIYDDSAVSATVYSWLRSQLGLSVGASPAEEKP